MVTDLPAMWSKFKPGDVICVTGSGHMAGHLGVYNRMAAPGWAVVSFEACGRIVPIRVKEFDLSLHQ